MKKQSKRFVSVFREGSELSSEGIRHLLVDTRTGVTYLFVKSGYGAGITPLLDRDGKVVITRVDDESEEDD
ncbi:MAG: hypothetical protein IJL26_09220 [Clostridia bacterium]|nr:hypothetical protein [Clostridia bacterium]